MSALLNHLLTNLKISKEYNTDNVSFRIFTQLSFGIFVSCSLMGGLTSYIGEDIKCIENKARQMHVFQHFHPFEATCFAYVDRNINICLQKHKQNLGERQRFYFN